MTAGLVTIRELLKPGVFDGVAARAEALVDGIQSAASEAGVPIQAGRAGTMFGFYFLKEAGGRIVDYDSAKALADTERFARYFHAMLERGFYFAPSQFEAGFMSSAHSATDVEATIEAARAAMGSL
jgi:glutamate-1-semialdehyde 2,1-aminomutase